MKTRLVIVLGLCALMLPWIHVQEAGALEPIVMDKTVAKVDKRTEITRVADNVVVLFDTSGSMGDPYHDTGMTKVQAAKRLLKQRVEWLPDEFPELNVGLYSFTPPTKLLPDTKGYKVFYKMQPLQKEELLAAIDQLPEKASGPTLLQNALIRLEDLLKELSGRTVVFLFTDGTITGSERLARPVVTARQLARKYDVSFVLISTTDNKRQQQIMEQVASINESSRVFPLEALLDRPERYTGSVFIIEEFFIITAEKREKVVGFKLNHVLFDFDKSDLKMEFTTELDAVGQKLKENPQFYVVLAGFTDNVGTEEYNLGLSHRRVEAVGNYLTEKYDVDRSRIILHWYGMAAPVASNDTPEGRAKNRRVLGFIVGSK